MLAEKYRPKTLKGIVGNDYQINTATDWLTKRLKQSKAVKRVLLIHGQAGVGKTTLVICLANDFNLNLNEVNASDSRKGEDLKTIAKQIDNLSLTGQKTITFFDEVDGLKTWALLRKICEKAKSPIIMSCNDLTKVPNEMRELCQIVPFNPSPDKYECLTLLKNICKKEKIKFKEEDLRKIIKRNLRVRDQLQALELRFYGGYVKDDISIWRTVDLILKGAIKPKDIQYKVSEMFFIIWSKMSKTRENIDRMNWINNHLKDGTEEEFLRNMLVN